MLPVEPRSAPLTARLFVALQHLLPQHLLSRLAYRITRSRAPLVKDALISRFVRHFQPAMHEAVQTNALSYGSFNEFFTRALRPQLRPIDPDPNTVVSPVDGSISQIGSLDGANILQAKGHAYSLQALLSPPAGEADPCDWASRFVGGAFTTLYLAPFNYHRIHMPLSGTLRAAWYVPGSLFSVNAVTAAAVAGLFARNERVICVFEDGPRVFAIVLVGALFVGSMATVWHGEITPRRPRRPLALHPGPGAAPLRLEKGAEMGRFNMGSTVIVLLQPGMAQWSEDWRPQDRVVVGQGLARLIA
ncbi:MAG TPA: archaetidylserine decarboxylase [Steroidobacteraceae bacterium]